MRTVTIRIHSCSIKAADFAVIQTYTELQTLRVVQDGEICLIEEYFSCFRSLGDALAKTPIRALFLINFASGWFPASAVVWHEDDENFGSIYYEDYGDEDEDENDNDRYRLRCLRALLRPFARRPEKLGGSRLEFLYGDSVCPLQWNDDQVGEDGKVYVAVQLLPEYIWIEVFVYFLVFFGTCELS